MENHSKNTIKTLDLNAYQIAHLLRLTRSIILAVSDKSEFAEKVLEKASTSHIELNQAEDLLKELSDNFFPMAHSPKPLRDLEIKDKEDVAKFKGLLKDAQYKIEDISEIFDQLQDRIRRLED